MERVRHHRRGQHVFDGEGLAVHGLGVGRGVGAGGHGDRRQLFGGGPELEHVPGRGQGVGGDDRPAVGGLVLGRAAHPRPLGEVPPGAELAAEPAELVGAVGDEDGLAQPGLDGRRGVLDVELEARSPRHGAVGEAGGEAEVLDHDPHVVGAGRGLAPPGTAVAVDVGLGHPGVGQGALGGQDVVADRVEVGGAGKVARAHAHDHRGPPARDRAHAGRRTALNGRTRRARASPGTPPSHRPRRWPAAARRRAGAPGRPAPCRWR